MPHRFHIVGLLRTNFSKQCLALPRSTFVCSSLHLCLSSSIFHFVCCISGYRSVQDTTPEGVFSSCGSSLTLTLTTSIGIWHGAGATKYESSFLTVLCLTRFFHFTSTASVCSLCSSVRTLTLVVVD